MRRGSGDEAVAIAVERSKSTASLNIPTLPDLPLPEDTANLRLGPDINPELLALLPLVGVWRGEGEGHDETGDYAFGQQIVISHDGGPYLNWESRSWRLDAEGKYVSPDLRESGYWRMGGDGIPGQRQPGSGRTPAQPQLRCRRNVLRARTSPKRRGNLPPTW